MITSSSKVVLTADTPITELVWNCEKFNMEVNVCFVCFFLFVCLVLCLVSYNSLMFNVQERDDTSNPFVDNKFNARFDSILNCKMFCTTTISCVVFHNHKHQNIVIRILTIVISVGCAVWRCASRTGMSNCSPAMMMSLHRFDRFDVYLCDTDVKDPIAASPHGVPWDESGVEQLWRTAGSCWTGEYYH